MVGPNIQLTPLMYIFKNYIVQMLPRLQTGTCLVWTGKLNTSWHSSGNMFLETQTWCWWDTPSAATLFWTWWRETLNSRQVTIQDFLFRGNAQCFWGGTTFIRVRVRLTLVQISSFMISWFLSFITILFLLHRLTLLFTPYTVKTSPSVWPSCKKKVD